MLTLHLLAPAAAQATLEVGQDPSFPTVQSAISAASDGDTIRIHAGLGGDQGAYTESILVLGLQVTLEGVGDPVLQPSSSFNGFLNIASGAEVTITGVTLDGRGANRAARISGDASLTLRDSTVRDTYNSVTGGGSFSLSSGRLIVHDTTFTSARVLNSERRGGMIATEGDAALEVHDSSFIGGRSEQDDGGAIYCGGSGGCVITGSLFVDNAAGADGGAISGGEDVPITIEDSRFCGNEARGGDDDDGVGGALELRGDATVAHSVFIDNTAEEGGALWLGGDDPVLQLDHNDFLANGALSHAPALFADEGSLLASHNLFMDHGPGTVVDLGDASATLSYTLWFNNAGPASPQGEGTDAVTGDPAFTDLDYADCEGSVLTLQPDSAALDAGDPAQPDEDGSPADIGAFGPHGDPTTPTADTGTPTGPSPTEPTDAPRPPLPEPAIGCGCATGGPVGPVGMIALLLACSRRRRRDR